jgi:hypothetical protein
VSDADDIEQLRAWGRDLAAAETSLWQPRTIAQAWATPAAGKLALTMQGWIDLDAVRSPLLEDRAPESEEELAAAWCAFGLVWEGWEKAAAVDATDPSHIVRSMLSAVHQAFAAVLPMRPEEADAGTSGPDGFGDWLPVFTALVTRCRLSLAEARALRVDAAFTLIAGERRDHGWRPQGAPYALRDAEASSTHSSTAQPEEAGA